jgi:hypothetical protein
MALHFDIKDDILYQLGYEESQEKVALNMLREAFEQELVARLTELPLERVAQLKLELDTSSKAS